MDLMRALFDALMTRPRPEDVADLVLQALGQSLLPTEKKTLKKASDRSFRKMVGSFSSMAADFSRPHATDRQVHGVATVFQVEPLSAVECVNPDKVIAFISDVGKVLHRSYGEARRLNRAERKAVGILKGHRWYNKRFKVLRTLEMKVTNLARNIKKYDFTRIGKSAMATRISFESFSANLNTACFVAYLSARMSLRSVFTNGAQDLAHDEIAEMLFRRCEKDPEAQWGVIAHLTPERRVLCHLSDNEKGELLGTWWTCLTEMADMLHEIWNKSKFDRAQMVVSRGDDSSTWNQIAGGWNRARDHWISLIHALDMTSALNEVLPGKVMRLMASDVVAWHQGGIHPDTSVWANLPPPWEVVRGETTCGRSLVEATCIQYGVDPEKWTGWKKDKQPVAFRPTRELVHGVTVANPALAGILRRAGAFSGKGLQYAIPSIRVRLQEDGENIVASDRIYGVE